MTFSITTLSKMSLYATLSITVLRAIVLSVAFFHYYADCHYAECRYTELRGAKNWTRMEVTDLLNYRRQEYYNNLNYSIVRRSVF